MIIAGSAVNFAQAANSENKEAKELQLFNQATISLQDAIKAAEQKTGGKALEAEFNDESAAVQFEIEILKDGKVHEVIVMAKPARYSRFRWKMNLARALKTRKNKP